MAHSPKWHIRAERYRRQTAAAPPRTPRSLQAPPDSTGYIWRIDPKDWSVTRADHRRLNGKRFRWDEPPVHDQRTGERAHPGMDRHCRCYAEPVYDDAPPDDDG